MKKFKDFIETVTEQNLYEMSNLGPKTTGLDEVIWVSVKNANHGPRIKVFENKNASGKTFSVTVEDEPKVIGDSSIIDSKQLEKIKKFIIKNKENLIKYWEFQVDTGEFIQNIMKV